MIQQVSKRYDAYRDSEIEWIGDIPANWDLKRFKDFSKILSGFSPEETNPDVAGKVVYYKVDDLNSVSKTGHIKENTWFCNYEKKIYKENILLLPKRGMSILTNKVGITEKKCIFDTNLMGLRLSSRNVSIKYVFYWIINVGLSRVADITTIPQLNNKHIYPLLIQFPSQVEQNAIAYYLDEKTAKIDQQIDLLTQKAKHYGELKQALIYETVRRGLDKSVPMKDSGVEWIGEIPEHWEIKRLKDVFQEKSGYGFPHEAQGDADGVIPFYKVSDINGTDCYVSLSKNHVTYETIKNYRWNLIPKNTIVTAKIGEALKKNHRKITTQNCLIDNNCLGLFPLKFEVKFSYYLLKIIDFDLFTNTGAVPSVSKSDMRCYLIPFPTFQEQKAIADYLDEKTTQIDAIVEAINAQIEKLKELRKTLINDVVTGKICIL